MSITETIYIKTPIRLQNSLCSLKGWSLKKQRFNSDFFSYLSFLEKSSSWNKSKLEEYQVQKLKEIVSYAFSYIPYYHQLFLSLKLHPDDIKTFADLKKIPSLEKETIRFQQNALLSTKYTKHALLKGQGHLFHSGIILKQLLLNMLVYGDSIEVTVLKWVSLMLL